MPLESPLEYLKFAAVILAILLVGSGLAWLRDWTVAGLMASVMSVFFLTFAAFKLVSLEMFAITFAGYDIIAKKHKLWAYTYPFVQIFLGLGYFYFGSETVLHIITILISLVAGIGVLNELRKKSDIPCACLGTVIRLPLSKISFVEDFAMLIMAVFMLAI